MLIAGVATRAMAESAARAGYAVCAVDAFGDMDHPGAPALSLARDLGARYSAHAAARASRDLECDAVCYVSNLENHPRAVELLARDRALWGNAPAILRRARDPLLLARILAARGLATPRVRASAPRTAAGAEAHSRWLSKPRASGGGHEITTWRSGDTVSRRRVLQEYIHGVPGSLAFVASGRHAAPFALTRQLVGDAEFGASGFRYCGSILARDAIEHTAQTSSALTLAAACANALTEELGLVGVNCLDFIAREGTPYPIELNPRHSASMELAEHAFGISVFGMHAAGCQGTLPQFDLAHALHSADGAVGKAVLFARSTVTVGDTRPWLASGCVRDIPHSGELIPAGHPICTIFARGADAAECYAGLVRLARKMYEECSGESRVASRERTADCGPWSVGDRGPCRGISARGTWTDRST